MVTISLCIFYPDSVNASQSPSPSGDISTNDVTNDLDDVKSLDSGDKDLADATSDSTNGLNIYYNNESGSLSTPVRMFLVLTVLSLAPSILIMLTSLQELLSYCILSEQLSVPRQHHLIRSLSVWLCF